MKDLKNILKEIALTEDEKSIVYIGTDFNKIVKDSFAILLDYGISGGSIVSKLNSVELTSKSKDKLECFKKSISSKLNKSIVIKDIKSIGQSMYGFQIVFKNNKDIEQYASVIAKEVLYLK